MEINVKGQGEKSFKPDQIVIDVNISDVYRSYDDALVKGEECVLEFLNEMKQFGFNFDDFKTTTYNIRDEVEYKNNVYKKIGVRYTRGLKLKFDYDMQRMAKIVEASSKLKNAPKINVKYGLKDTRKAEMDLYADAYENAKFQADIIAKSAGLKVVRCAKAGVEDNENSYHSNTCYESVRLCKCSSNASDNMAQTYIPEDITVSQEIYCVFIAE